MLQLSFVVTLISTSLAALMLVFGFAGAKSAPQEAAIAALAAAMAIVPYVFTRCLQLAEDRKAQAAALKRIGDLLEQRQVAAVAPAAPSVQPPSGDKTTASGMPIFDVPREAPAVQRTDWS